MDNEFILNKIRLLLNLANSPNENEAKNARDMADRLVAKYNITPEQLESIKEKKPAYDNDNKLFSSLAIESWRNQLALGICTKYECFLIQEETVPIDGISQFSYFVVGEPENITNVKFVYNVLEKKVEELVILNCNGKGPVYVHSYSEGVVEGIKSNLDFIYYEVEVKATNKPGPAATLNTGNECITKHSEKEKPLKETINIASQSFIKDVMAYFKGVSDGNRLSLQDVLELAEQNKIPEELGE
jgi:hypothetical protein